MRCPLIRLPGPLSFIPWPWKGKYLNKASRDPGNKLSSTRHGGDFDSKFKLNHQSKDGTSGSLLNKLRALTS